MTDNGFKRKLTAILSADVEGYSRLMGEDEEATIRTLTTYRSTIAKLVQQYRGRVVDSPGDNILSEFASAVDAVNCAVEIQRELAEHNADLQSNRRMEFRIGVNVGDVVQEKERIYGDGVNIAARVESMSQAGGICISGRAYDQVSNKLGLKYENLGKHEVKNIMTPIRIYRIITEKDPSIFFRYSGLAMAHFMAERYSEASHWAHKSVHRKPRWRGGHAVLASSLAHLNLVGEAKEAIANYLEIFPDETISALRKVYVIRSPDCAQRFEEGLRKAGLPE